MESSNCKATELQHDNVPGCAIGTTLHTSSRKSNDSTKGKNNPSKIVKEAGCRKCGSIVSHQPSQCPALNDRVFRRTWTDAKELLKEKSFFILSFVFLSEFVIRQVQTNIY